MLISAAVWVGGERRGNGILVQIISNSFLRQLLFTTLKYDKFFNVPHKFSRYTIYSQLDLIARLLLSFKIPICTEEIVKHITMT